ncbi:hypothetical protein [Psychrosphaera ytuae]|nr:hypothetical protein [Psychrosphaera ytuae]
MDMSLPLFDFFLASGLMAVGIGTDVALATLSRASRLTGFRVALFWIFGVSLTHTLFPMAGYLLTFFSIQLHPAITPTVGVIAFALIALYLKEELGEYGIEASKELSASNNHQQLMVTMGLILAVSWDALWSGPAKSAQVIGWPEVWVWASFVVVGCLISVLALCALRLGYRVSGAWQNSVLGFVAVLLQHTVIAYFGMLALTTYTLGLDLPWWLLMQVSLSLVVMTMIGLSHYRKRQQLGVH